MSIHPKIDSWLRMIDADLAVLPADDCIHLIERAESQLARNMARLDAWAADFTPGPNPLGDGVTAWDLAEAGHELNARKQALQADTLEGAAS